jgi:polysaccharide biosynthesis protein PslJ
LLYGWTRAGWRRLLGLTVAIMGAAGLLFSISRGAIVALVLVLFWLSYKRVPYSGRIIGLGAAFGAALVMFYPPLQERLLSMFSASNASTEIRFEEYAMFPEAMARYPLGIGFKVDPPVPGSGLLGISNLWLNFIYKIGLPGMALFVVVTTLWWRAVRPMGRVPAITHENALWLGSLSGVLAALLTGIFDHYYSFTFVIIGLFWLLAGLALQQARLFPQQTRGIKESSP